MAFHYPRAGRNKELCSEPVNLSGDIRLAQVIMCGNSLRKCTNTKQTRGRMTKHYSDDEALLG